MDLSADLINDDSMEDIDAIENENEGLTKAVYELMQIKNERRESVNATKEDDEHGL